MKKFNLFGWSLFFIFFLTGQSVFAEDVDLTNLIINNDFDYIAEGVDMTGEKWKPKEPADNQGYTEFYGWTCDLEALSGTSQGINKDFENQSGTYGAWISSTAPFPDFFEFYQIIDKDDLSAGTYKVQCLLSGTKLATSQRLFANQNVQYFKDEASYAENQLEDEIATFAGYPNPQYDKILSEMVVYTTIGENDSLKIGIRTGNKKSDGTAGGNQWGWFKTDYFRLTKIDATKAADATLSGITLSAGEVNDFDPGTITYAVTLPAGTQAVTPTATGSVEDVIIKGTEEVDVTSGSGSSVIIVTALDGKTTKIYTINYTVSPNTGVAGIDAKAANYFVSDGKLTVNGVDAYSVYKISGTKVADVESNTSIELLPGIYIVKTNTAQVFKVIIK